MTRITNLGLLAAVALSALSFASSANADEQVSLKLEPGVAIPVTQPQDKRFSPGAAGQAQLLFSLGSYFDIGPSAGLMALPSKIPGITSGEATNVGAALRLKRPHDRTNESTGLAAISPWVDVNPEYIRSGPLDRFGFSAAVGAQVPTGDDRHLWIGPFARYLEVFQDATVGHDTRNSKTMILGLSFEVGSAESRPTTPAPPPPPAPTPPVSFIPPPPPEAPPAPTPPVVVPQPPRVITQKVQFDFDKSDIREDQMAVLQIVSDALALCSACKVEVQGHASSEGQVEHNNRLSERRAEAVVNYLVDHGATRANLTAVGFGSSKPIATNDTEAGREANRRVSFDVSFVISDGSVRRDVTSQEGK